MELGGAWPAEWTLGTALGASAGLPICFIANPVKVEKWSAMIAGLAEKVSAGAARHAAASEVQGDVSAYVRETDSTRILPHGLKIEWVKEDDVEVSVDKRRGEVAVVMQYKKDSSRNFVSAIRGYTSKAFIPKARHDIPGPVAAAAELVVQEKLIRAKHEDALGVFNAEVVPMQIGTNEKVREMHKLLRQVDRLGFFENVFLNEVLVASEGLKNFDDPMKTDEFNGLINFLSRFYGRAHGEDVPLEHRGRLFSLNIILVARLGTMPRAGTAPYVSRAKASLSRGMRSIYVTGTRDDRRCVRDVVKSTSDQSAARLEWARDYKKMRGMEMRNYTIAFFRR